MRISEANNKKNMKALSDILKKEHYTFVRQDGHFGGNAEHSYIIFNITQEIAARLSGKFEQTSFFYCYPDDNENIVNEYWEKKDTKAPYNSIKNPYIFINKTVKVHDEKDADDFYSVIGHDYKYSIDCEVFNKVNDELNEALNNLRNKFNLINESSPINSMPEQSPPETIREVRFFIFENTEKSILCPQHSQNKSCSLLK